MEVMNDAALSLQMQHTFNAPRNTVFRAWTDPTVLTQWFRPGGSQTVSAHVDLRSGGSFKFQMRTPDDMQFTISGNYHEVNPPEKLVFTWNISISTDPESLVSIEFLDRGRKTDILLTHSSIASQDALQGFLNGWPTALRSLDAMLE